MEKISPTLWYDTQAKEAAAFYADAFANARVKTAVQLEGSPSGSVDLIDMEIEGHDFTLMAAGPYFKFTPAVSFMAAVKTEKEAEALWKRLSPGAAVMMDFGAYPFSPAYGWLADRFGVSWQVIAMGAFPLRSTIVPTLMFSGARCGKAEKAIRFYAGVFKKSSVGDILHYGKGEEPDAAGTVKHAEFTLEGQLFAAMDSARVRDAPFNEAISFVVRCADQEEIDYYWNALSADPASEQCGWLKDRYGLSWQIVPSVLDRMMASKDGEKVARVTAAFLAMKKFDLAALHAAYEGN